jgi:hypothetical protein
MTQYPLDHVPLTALDKTDDLHRRAALGALQRIDFASEIL